MKKFLSGVVLAVVFCAISATVLQAHTDDQKTYIDRWAYDWGRGLKNAVSFPAEIPMTIKNYHNRPGYPVLRHFAGFTDGLFRGVARMGSGLWDFLAGPLPGGQDGYPVTPETLF